MFLGTDETNIKMQIDGKLTTSQNSVVLLGVLIDYKLKFDSHIKQLCVKANRKINCLLRIRNLITTTQADTLANAYILSNFYYCCIVWMFCSRKLGNEITKWQKRCLKVIHATNDMSVNEMLLLFNKRSIHLKHLHFLLTEVFKSVKGNSPIFMADIFTHKEVSHNLRNKNLLSLPCTKTVAFGTNAFHFRAALLWNKLPPSIKKADSIQKFKNLLKDTEIICTCKLCS